MQRRELEMEGGSLLYEIRQGKILVIGLQGGGAEVYVPPSIEGMPVSVIERKAFLSRKNLRKVQLPETVEEIGDWAFAYCDGLEEVCLPHRQIQFCRAVFLDCGRLRKIRFPEGDEQTARLLAAAVTAFESYYLLDLMEVGSREWLEKWDARLLAVLQAPDSEGYAKQVLCGEEDYGSTDFGAFIRKKRKSKVRLALLRLLCPRGLSSAVRKELEEYLREHTKGCESDEAWQVVLKEHGSDRACYSLFAKIGCITEENFQDLIAEIGEDKPEMRAYFMRYKEENIGYTDFFDALALD